MRILVIVTLLTAVSAGAAMAEWPEALGSLGSGHDSATLAPQRDMFYCQDQTDFGAINSSVGIMMLADDLPVQLVGQVFNQSQTIVAQWPANLENWQDPAGIWLKVWTESCPPSDPLAPYMEVYVPWEEVTILNEFIFEPAEKAFKEIIFDHTAITITESMSIAFVVDHGWGMESPWMGIATSMEIYNSCMIYMYGPVMGYNDWTPFDELSDPRDLAFCIGFGAVAAESATWSGLKAIYR